MNKNFSIQESLQDGWRITKSNYLLILAVMAFPTLLSWVFQAIASLIQSVFSASNDSTVAVVTGVMSIVSIVASVYTSYLAFGVNAVYLRLVNKEPTKFSDIFTEGKLFWNYFLTSIGIGLLVLIGLILFIIPGIYFAIKYQFYPFVILDKKVGVGKALEWSGRLTDKVKLKLLAFGFASFIVNLVGLLLLGVGLFITVPTTTLAYVYVYRKLRDQAST